MTALAAMRPELRSSIRSRHLPLHVFRNTIHLGSQYLWATSLLLLPLATIFALEFTTPAWTLLLAVLVLGERLTASRIGAVVLGLLGRAGDPASRAGDLSAGRAAGARRGVRARRHPDRHQEADPDRQHLHDHLLDEPHPAAARPARLRPAVRDQARRLGRCRRSSPWARGPRLALLPDQRVSGRRRRRRGAARLHAHPADRDDRLVALRRDARRLRLHRRRPDHRRRPVEPAQRGLATVAPVRSTAASLPPTARADSASVAVIPARRMRGPIANHRLRYGFGSG